MGLASRGGHAGLIAAPHGPVPAASSPHILVSRLPLHHPFPVTIQREKGRNTRPIGIDSSFSIYLYFIKNLRININARILAELGLITCKLQLEPGGLGSSLRRTQGEEERCWQL